MNGNVVRFSDFSFTQCLLMLFLNSIQFFLALSVVLLFVYPWERGWIRCVSGIGCIYLFPPIAARLIKMILPIKKKRIVVGSREYFTWWAMTNLQIIFCRFPALEELLRLIPGLYSHWLRLWGAEIGRLTYWSPGTKILDRHCLKIGNNVIFGAGVRLNGHVLVKSDDGNLELLLSPIIIGDNVIVGGYSLLTAGTEIADGECTRAMMSFPPFTRWENGRRVDNKSAKE